MALRDDILHELEAAALLTHPDWGAVADRIMALARKAAKKGELPGKDTLSLAVEAWKEREAAGVDIFGRPRRPRPEEIFPVEPPPYEPAIYDKEPPDITSEENDE